jgi:cell division protein FtsN
MYGAFDEEQLPVRPQQRDTELTLSWFALLVGLTLVCGLCFGAGYAVGHRAAPQALAAAQPATVSTETASPAASIHPKPSANPQSQPATQKAASPAAESDDNGNEAAPATAAQPAVRAALPVATPAAQPAKPAGQPASSALMVQVAAVSHQEDADVLVGALRKHGYAVSVHREPVDGLLHVRIGPFSSRGEAGKWRDKLQGDGYNAIVQP